MLSKVDAELVRSQNRRLALDHFRRSGISTRRRMSLETNLSMSAAAAIASDLIRAGVLAEIVQDEPDAPARRGRPEVSLVIAPALASVAVLMIAVGEIAVTIAAPA